MPEKILIMSLTRIGDLVQATPLIQGLRENQPEARITLMVSSDFAEFAQRIPQVDECLVLNLRQFKSTETNKNFSWVQVYRYLEGFLEEVREQKYARVINLSHSCLSALMISYLGIQNVCGFHCNEAGERVTGQPWMQYFGIEAFNRIYNSFNLVEIFSRSGDISPEGRQVRIRSGPEDFAAIAGLLESEGIGPDDILIGIQAGSSLETRRWPARSFAELADRLAEKLGARILLLGVAAEGPLAAEIAGSMKKKDRVVDLTGKTDISQLIALLKQCRYLVTNDTGTMHIAAALGTPIVGLFFAHAHPYETAPYAPGHLIFQARIPCAPCSYGVTCNNMVCLHKVTPRHVYSMIEEHGRNGVWRLPGDMGPLSELNIFQTGFDVSGRLRLQPLICHPVTLTDVFLQAYTRLWLDFLGDKNAINPEKLSWVPDAIRQDYDCREMGPVLDAIREKLHVVQMVAGLSEQGREAAEAVFQLMKGSGMDKGRLNSLGEEITQIDDQLNILGAAHPEVRPLTNLFAKRKENVQGEDLVQLARQTQRCYLRLVRECAGLTHILNTILQKFAAWDSPGTLIEHSSMSVAVPGR